jgi:hypothetical protein
MRKFLFMSAITVSLCTGALAAQQISVEDFVVDAKTLQGKEVVIRGSVTCMGAELCIISGDESDTATVTFDPSPLPREDRRKLVSCDLVSSCDVQVTGVARAHLFTQLNATSISW